MEQYAKLYRRILDSSVWKLPSDIRIVWFTLLALKDMNGCVFGSMGWLADQAIVSDEMCRKAIEIFLAPDDRSRTPDNEGRKIERINGGWKILNHHLYRDEMEEQREKWARQKAVQRAHKKEKDLEARKRRAELDARTPVGLVTTTDELAKIVGEFGALNDSDDLTPEERRQRVLGKIAHEEAVQEKVREKFNPDYLEKCQ